MANPARRESDRPPLSPRPRSAQLAAPPPPQRLRSRLRTKIAGAVLAVALLVLAPLATNAWLTTREVSEQVEARVESLAEVFGQLFATSVLAGEDANWQQLQQVIESIQREDRDGFYAYILVEGEAGENVVGAFDRDVLGPTYEGFVRGIDDARRAFEKVEAEVRAAEAEADALAAVQADPDAKRAAAESTARTLADLRAQSRERFRALNAAKRELYSEILRDPARAPGLRLYRAILHDCRETGTCPRDPDALEKRKAATVLVGIAWAPFVAEQWRSSLVLGSVIGGALLLGLAGALLLARSVTKPVQTLVDAMGEVQRGRLDRRVDADRGDEIGVLARSFNVMAAGLEERERLREEREALVHIVEEEEKLNRELAAKNAQIRTFLAGLASSQVAQQFLQERPQLDFRGTTEEATVLFADIRGFTTMCERMSAEEIFDMLNDYFPRMRKVIDVYGGCILKFMGDALMVAWNVPARQDHHALRAVLTGIAMQRELLALNREREAAGKDPINVGIGVNTGRLMVGNVGSKERFDYTVIGDAVNTAQRIESITPAQHLHVSETTYQLVREYVDVVARDPVTLKGKEKPVQIFAVIRKKKDVPMPVEPKR